MPNFSLINVETQNESLIKYVLFAVASIFFLCVTFLTIQDLIYGIQKNNILFFILYLISIGVITANIIINLSNYKQIRDKIDKVNASALATNEIKYSNTIWIFPLICFIYFVLLIFYLILLFHKCS